MKTHIQNLPNLARLVMLLLLTTLNSQLSTLFAQGTAFTYQGRLNDNSAPASGNYDLRFAIYDSIGGPTMIAEPLTNSAVAVSNGLFAVTLDFGTGVFSGPARWLDIAVRTNGGEFAPLSPRQQITATPYAITASNLSGPLPAAQLSGTLATAQLGGTYSGAVTLNNAGNSFTGNGGGLTNVNAATLGGLSGASFWRTNGNAGANPTNGAFLGTTDNQPLESKVNGQRALRIEYATNSTSGYSPNIVGGFSGNIVSNGFGGAVIGGGGSPGSPNRAGRHFATVVGGVGNTASGDVSTAMGNGNTASGYVSTAMGRGTTASGQYSIATGFASIASGDHSVAMGYNNRASGDYSVAMGSGNTASYEYSTAMGVDNTASGYGSTAMGIGTFASGHYSTAMGYLAMATNVGSFVWADNQLGNFASTANNQFLIRASGGVGINTPSPSGAALAVNGNITISQNNVLELGYGVAGKEISAGKIGYQTFTVGALDIVGAGTPGLNTRKIKFWCEGGATFTGAITAPSDRNLKQDFQPLDGRTVLEKVVALPVQSWAYKFDTIKRHIGPVAQDFHAAFGLNGDDDTGIATVDADGVALAAIQGLNQKLEAEVKSKDARITELEQRLSVIETLLKK